MTLRKSLMAATCLAAMAGFASTVYAGETSSATNARTQLAATQASESPDMLRASKFIGQTVRNGKGEKIGTVDDLILNQGDRILYAVISVGGFLGVGDRLVAVPFEELTFGSKDVDGVVLYGMSKGELESVPPFTYAEAKEGTSRERFMQSAERRVDFLKGRVGNSVGDANSNAKDMKEGASEKVDTAWKKTQVEWKKLKGASADAWQSAKQKFDNAMSDLERAWDDATS
jgi:sporulation protein YlmC with PRC-barrel domain